MKRIFYLLFPFIVLGFYSCNETLEDDDVQTIISEKPNSDLYFSEYGISSFEALTTDESYTDTITIINNTGASVSFSLEVDETLIESHNAAYETEYKAIASEHYSLDAESFTAEGTELRVPITFYTSKMVEDIGGAYGASQRVLPLKIIAGDEVDVNSVIGTTMLSPNIEYPTVQVYSPVDIYSFDDTTENTVFNVEMSYNTKSFDCGALAVYGQDGLVDSYNEANGTAYQLLPGYAKGACTIDAENKTIAVEFSFNNSALVKETEYLLPIQVDALGGAYSIEGENVNYYIVKVNNTVPEYLNTFVMPTLIQPQLNDYSGWNMTIDLEEAAALFGITVEKLKENVVLNAFNEDGTFATAYTANNGFWMNKSGFACNWGETDCSIFAEYDAGSDGNLKVGQFPEANQVGDIITFSLVLVYDGTMIKYDFTVKIRPEFTATYQATATVSRNVEYLPTAVNIDMNAIALDLGFAGREEIDTGLSESRFFFRMMTENGNIVDAVSLGINGDGNPYTANSGFWINSSDEIILWGGENCAYFLEYGWGDLFNFGQFPDFDGTGMTYTPKIVLDTGDKMVVIEMTLNVTP